MREEVRRLLETVDRPAERAGLFRLSASARCSIETLLTASQVTVEVANNPVKATNPWGERRIAATDSQAAVTLPRELADHWSLLSTPC
jgi:hypothetical protein